MSQGPPDTEQPEAIPAGVLHRSEPDSIDAEQPEADPASSSHGSVPRDILPRPSGFGASFFPATPVSSASHRNPAVLVCGVQFRGVRFSALARLGIPECLSLLFKLHTDWHRRPLVGVKMVHLRNCKNGHTQTGLLHVLPVGW